MICDHRPKECYPKSRVIPTIEALTLWHHKWAHNILSRTDYNDVNKRNTLLPQMKKRAQKPTPN